jgi:hypothetical protein
MTLRFANHHERKLWCNTITSCPGFEDVILRADAFVLAMRERNEPTRIEDHPHFEKTVIEAAEKTCERAADWLREHGNGSAYERDVTCDCGGFNSETSAPDIDKLADAIEGAVARVILPATP